MSQIFPQIGGKANRRQIRVAMRKTPQQSKIPQQSMQKHLQKLMQKTTRQTTSSKTMRLSKTMRKINPLWFCMIGVIALPACAQSYYNQNYAQDQSAYVVAQSERLANAQDISGLVALENQNRGRLFALYPIYYRLNAQIDSITSDDVYQFVRTYPDTMLGEKIAADFAENRASRGDYRAVMAVADLIQNPDESEWCALGLGFLAYQDMRVALAYPYAKHNSQIKAPLCLEFAQKIALDAQTSNYDKHAQLMLWLRQDMRTQSKQKQDFSNQIDALARQLNLTQFVQNKQTVRQNPRTALAQYQNAITVDEQYLWLYALSLLTHDIQSDKSLLQELPAQIARANVSAPIVQAAYRALGVARMNLNTTLGGFDKVVLDWFAKGGNSVNFEEAEDYAQAAIYFADWQALVRAVDMMGVQAQERAWQYWRARALAGLGQTSQAKAIYQNIATSDDFYGILAKERLGLRVSAPSKATTDNRAWADASFARALQLMDNYPNYRLLDQQWRWAVRMAQKRGDKALLASAMDVAMQKGRYDLVMSAAERTDMGAYSHPMLYTNEFNSGARSAGIDMAWAYGIARQESRFNPNARSKVATGLMQLKDSTAKQVGKSIGVDASNLKDPRTNVRLGTQYLANTSARFGGNMAAASAAYNAGDNPVKAWLPSVPMDGDRFAETIPYVETRDYVKAVGANTVLYQARLGQNPSLLSWLGTVTR